MPSRPSVPATPVQGHHHPTSPTPNTNSENKSVIKTGASGPVDNNEILLLPRFKKNQRQIDHSDHSWCCDKEPETINLFRRRTQNDCEDGKYNYSERFTSLEVQQSFKPNELGIIACASSHVGTRDHMEDRHRIHYGTTAAKLRAHNESVANHNMSTGATIYPYRGFFGVFDGHGGEESAHFAGKNLYKLIQETAKNQVRQRAKQARLLKLAQQEAAVAAGKANPEDNHPEDSKSSIHAEERLGVNMEDELNYSNLDYPAILKTAFDLLEEGVLRLSREVGCRDGTTATTVLITEDTIFCANTGDSRTVLCRAGQAIPLSTDHKPHTDTERARIISAGGQVRAVMQERAGFCCFKPKRVPQGAERLWPGGFSVSRALGDIDYKDLRRRKCKVVQVLIHNPDIVVTPIEKADEFIILASDGLWDCMTPQAACDFVWKCLKKKGCDPLTVAAKLTDRAFSLGSEDNITAVVVYFNEHDLSARLKRKK